MNPFQIQCETCKTSLRVRDPGFVGQVHACPNCGSMVLIAAPISKEEHDAQTARVDSNQPEPEKPTFLGLSDTLTPNDYSFEAPTAHVEEQIPQGPIARETSAQEAGEAEVAVDSAEVNTPSAKLLIAKGPLIWLTLGMIATGGFTLLALWPSDNVIAEVTSEAEPTSEALLESNSNTDQVESSPISTSANDREQTLATDQSQTVQVNKPTIDDEPSSGQPETTPDLPTSPDTNADALLPKEIKQSEKQSIDEPIARLAMTEQPAPKFDPLDYDPTSIDMVLHPNAKEPTADETPIEQIALLPPNERRTEADQLFPIAPKPRANQAVSVALIAKGPEPSSAAESLAMPIPKIDLKKIPIATAINLLSELSGTPITLDPISLKQAGIDARRKVNVTGEGVALGEVLTATLKTVRLEYRTDEDNVVTYRPGVEQSKSAKHKLADLIGSNVGDLENLLTQIGPSTVAEHGIEIAEDGTFTLNAPRRTQYDLILLTERLRLARGLQPQSKYPRRLLSSEPVLAQLATALEHRTTFSFVTPTSLRQIFEHWSQATGLTILVDWQSLSKIELSPQSMLTASANQRSWTEALDGILNPLGLAWAPVDRQTIWITTIEREADSPYVEFYPGLNEATAVAISDEHPQALVAYDLPSRTTIVRGNTAAQRRAYALWLEQ